MTEIYLVRHGYTKSNELDVFLGQQNIDLTDKGRKQAECVGEYLKDKNISMIYSSDLDRACQTAEPLSNAIKLPIIKRENLREIAAGEWDWVSYEQINEKYSDAWWYWGNDICNSYCVGGETFLEVQERVYGEMVKIAEESDGKTITVFSHGTSIKSFLCKVLGLTGKEANDLTYPGNASVTRLLYDNGKFTADYVGYNKHLGELATNLVLKK